MFSYLFFFLVFYSVYSAEDLQCKENEVKTSCMPRCPYTCQRPFDAQCEFFACWDGCICKKGYVFDNSGTCIPATRCAPECNLNQTYTSCGSSCPKTCDGTKTVCTGNCVPGCTCKKNYILSSLEGNCILKTDCLLS